MNGVFDFNFDFPELDALDVLTYRDLLNGAGCDVIYLNETVVVPVTLRNYALGRYAIRLEGLGVDVLLAKTYIEWGCYTLTTKENWALFKAWCRLIAGGSKVKAEELFWAVLETDDKVRPLVPAGMRDALYTAEYGELDEWGLPVER